MYSLHTRRKLFLTVAFFTLIQTINCDIAISTHDLQVQEGDKTSFRISFSDSTIGYVKIRLKVQHEDIVKLNQTVVELQTGQSAVILAEGTTAGHSEITANSTDARVDEVYLRITVYKNKGLKTFSLIIGWLYFVAWSISFYPQVYINYKRKSVVGLNFDFLALNVVGFLLYSTFNLGLYCIPEIEEEYFSRFPRGLNPVQLNDIVFAVHAAAATALTITQCFLYDRGEQRVSITARGILGIFGTFLFISLILSTVNVLHWLDFLYFCSYVKLTTTLIKYIPQAYMNYKRQSTVGWSIGNILLDFTGGSLSMLQMILNSYNYNDWVSIFGDPTKFGLGLFSVVFDVFFMIQHYILYKLTRYDEEQLQ